MATATLSVNYDLADMPARSNGVNTTSGSDGQFSLPPEVGNIDVAATCDKGLPKSIRTRPAARIVLRLSAWGSISGKVTNAGKPGANQQIIISSDLLNPYNAYVASYAHIVTDADSNYHLNRVFPVNIGFSAELSPEKCSRNWPITLVNEQREMIDVGPGQSVTADFGGAGRRWREGEPSFRHVNF